MPRSMLYSIDLKDGTKRDAELVYAIISAYGLENKVIWGATLSDTHAYLLELEPKIARYYPLGDIVKAFLW